MNAIRQRYTERHRSVLLELRPEPLCLRFGDIDFLLNDVVFVQSAALQGRLREHGHGRY